MVGRRRDDANVQNAVARLSEAIPYAPLEVYP